MLSSTNRRILHVICVSLAILTMFIGLGMKYIPQNSDIKELSNTAKTQIVAASDSTSLYVVEETGDPD